MGLQISSKDQEIAAVKKDAKTRIEELSTAASEADSGLVIETQQEEITRYPCSFIKSFEIYLSVYDSLVT